MRTSHQTLTWSVWWLFISDDWTAPDLKLFHGEGLGLGTDSHNTKATKLCMLHYHTLPLFHCHSSLTLSEMAGITVWKRWKCLSMAGEKKKKTHDYTVMPVKYTNSYNSLTSHCGTGKYLLKYLLMKGRDIWWQSSQESETYFRFWEPLYLSIKGTWNTRINYLVCLWWMCLSVMYKKEEEEERERVTNPLIYCTPWLCACVL